MNYFELYPGDYLRDTSRLSLLEHGAYFRLMLAYYGEGEPLPAVHAELYNIVSAVNAADKAAVRKVADKYFPVDADGIRRNGRADREIAKAKKRMAASRGNGAKGGRPKKPAENLMGIPTGNPMGFETGGFSEPRTNPEKTCSGEALQNPDPISTPEGLPRAEKSLTARAPEDDPGQQGLPSAAGAACLAMRRGGIATTNPSHPNLLAAIGEGATLPMWEHTAFEACSHDPPKGFAWVIATVRGRLADAAAIHTGASHATHPRSSGSSLADQVPLPDDEGTVGYRDRDAIDSTAVRIAHR